MNIFKKLHKKIINHFGENKIVKIIFKSSSDEVLSCIGVLTNEDRNKIKIAFNAKENQIIDFLEIPKDNIIEIKKVNKKDITFYK